MEDKVWSLQCAESEVAEYESRFRVTSIAKTDEGSVLLRVLSEGKPTDDATILAPTLEDYYLSNFGEFSVYKDIDYS